MSRVSTSASEVGDHRSHPEGGKFWRYPPGRWLGDRREWTGGGSECGEARGIERRTSAFRSRRRVTAAPMRAAA